VSTDSENKKSGGIAHAVNDVKRLITTDKIFAILLALAVLAFIAGIVFKVMR